MKHISTEIFVQVDTHVDYTIRFCGYLGVKFSALELNTKYCFASTLSVENKLY